MYRILLVDDEDYALEGLLHGIPFEELGFEKVFTAGNAVKARELLLMEPIDVLLCDIEMPGESGLELLKWAGELQLPAVPIILTCHADFEYSRRALQLGSLDYILKPAAYEEVTQALKRAVRKVERLNREEDARRRETLLLKNQDRLAEELWKEILSGELPLSEKLLCELCTYKGLDYTENGRYRFVLLDMLFKHKDVDAQEDKNVRFAICNMAEEILVRKRGWIYLEKKEFLVAVLPAKDEPGAGEEGLKNDIREFMRVCRQYLECYFNAFYSPAVTAEEILPMYDRLREKARRQVLKKDLVAEAFEELPVPESRFSLPDLEQWTDVMRTGNEKEIRDRICGFTRRNASEENLNNGILEYYTAACMQAAYTCAAEWKSGMEFLVGTEMQIRMNKAFRSVEQFELFVELLAQELCARRREQYPGGKKRISDQTKEYVAEHLGERLLNEEIARYLFLNADYLNRIFKKETGITLNEYISRKRVEKAKELLLTTALPVSEIAFETGFQSFSYFTKVFKKRTGKEPSKYRKEERAK